MEHSYTDYLFILALYDKSVPLEKLLFHLEGSAGVNARAQALETLAEMEGKGLVAITRRGGSTGVRLTALGRRLSDKVAGYMADNMVEDWHARQVSFPGQNAANY